MAKTVTYEGTTDQAKNASGSVEIDGKTLAEGEPVTGLTSDQIKRLEELAYHRFTVGDDDKGGKG